MKKLVLVAAMLAFGACAKEEAGAGGNAMKADTAHKMAADTTHKMDSTMARDTSKATKAPAAAPAPAAKAPAKSATKKN
jgi:hypothetical protein